MNMGTCRLISHCVLLIVVAVASSCTGQDGVSEGAAGQ